MGKSTISIGKSPCFMGKSTISIGTSPCFMGKSTISIGTSPCFMGKSTISIGTSPCFMGKSTISIGKSPCFMGKSTISIGTSPCFMGKSTISMAMFHSYVWHNQAGYPHSFYSEASHSVHSVPSRPKFLETNPSTPEGCSQRLGTKGKNRVNVKIEWPNFPKSCHLPILLV